jgi:hypothetical protein
VALVGVVHRLVAMEKREQFIVVAAACNRSQALPPEFLAKAINFTVSIGPHLTFKVSFY